MNKGQHITTIEPWHGSERYKGEIVSVAGDCISYKRGCRVGLIAAAAIAGVYATREAAMEAIKSKGEAA